MRSKSRFALVLLAAILCAFPLGAAFAAPASRGPLFIDLNAQSLYARVGFDAGALTALPAPGARGWKTVPPAGAGGRTVRPADLGFEGYPQRRPFSLERFRLMEFTFLIPFQVTPAMAALLAPDSPARAAMVPGISFAGLGDNWEVYLNGSLVKSEMHLSDKGGIALHRSMRGVHFPLDPRLLREGQNILALRIVADPSFLPSGFNQASPYYIDDYERIEAANADIWPMILIGLYLFIGLYHIF
ncbi:MAG TPA: histidine kinase, partial [Rectinemataceae bacterium]|nr:histidine kinase [Rectinemataceae bacterium]